MTDCGYNKHTALWNWIIFGKFTLRNEYTVKDSFEAVDKIHKILVELFDQGYRYFSFDVTSLFANVLLSKTINFIIDRVYKENIIDTKLKKSTLKKIIKDCCTKTVFSFDNIIYKQKDDVSMGSSLGPVPANVIITELEKKTCETNNGVKKIEILYETKKNILDDINHTFGKFNSIDRFDHNNLYFLGIVIYKIDNDLHYKPTDIG